MPQTKPLAISVIKLDLKNYRMPPRKDELEAASTMIQSSPDRFWALAESLIEDGYLPTENIVILKTGPQGKELVVREGNRRIAILKMIHCLLDRTSLNVPTEIEQKMRALSKQWLKDNANVPCLIFEPKDAALVDRIVNRAHGKGEKTGREQWSTVARARHNRDANGSSEPALDFLEKYLKNGQNLSGQQRDRWSADYRLPLLNDVAKKIAPRIGLANAPDLVSRYPSISYRAAVEDILRDIGLGVLDFPKFRDTKTDFGLDYGLPLLNQGKGQPGGTQTVGNTGQSTPGNQASGPGATASAGASSGQPSGGTQTSSSSSTTANSPQTGPGTQTTQPGPTSQPSKAYAISDPRQVRKLLKDFNPRGANRQKVVDLRDEAKKLDISKTPFAFCFVLRSLFEVSAKAYAADHPNEPSLSLQKPGQPGKPSKDKTLAELLEDITRHLIGGNNTSPISKALQGAKGELKKPDGLLSVTNLNQLVHSPTLSIIPADICRLFGNIYPLLEAMN